MRQPARVGGEHVAQVGHAVFEHGEAIDAHAPGEALIFLRVDAASLQHVRMHHAAAEDFQPRLAGPDLQLAFFPRTAHVHFGGRLGEREVVRAELGRHAVGLEEARDEGFQHPFELAHMRALVDDEALDLMEHRRVGLVGIAAEHPARRDQAEGRPARQHGADLHRRGVGAQKLAHAVFIGIEEKRVVHFARRMLVREVERGEVMEIVLDVRAFGDREAHLGEDGDDLVHDLQGRMHAAARTARAGQGEVDALVFQTLRQMRGLQRGLARLQRGGHRVAHGVDRRAGGLARLRRQGAEGLQKPGDAPGLAQSRHAHGVQRGQVRNGGDFGFDVVLQVGIGGHCFVVCIRDACV